jgi:tripartite motif-containing protein 71
MAASNGQFSQPEGLTIDSLNNIYVADYGNNVIKKFDTNGNYLSLFGYTLPSDGAFNTPRGIAADSAGNVYVADTLNDRIEKFDNFGNISCTVGNYLEQEAESLPILTP